MKPTAYLPFFGNDFFEAIAGYSDTVGLGYLRAIWHYWNHTGCEGLPDDDDYLRRICVVDSAQWPAVKSIIFDNRYNFRCVDGRWHQSHSREVWEKAVTLYDKKVKRTEAARAALATTRTVTKTVTEPPTDPVTERNHNHNQNHNQRSSHR